MKRLSKILKERNTTSNDVTFEEGEDQFVRSMSLVSCIRDTVIMLPIYYVGAYKITILKTSLM